MIKKITVLGSTGSIGVSTLEVISHHRDQFEVFALTAHKQVEALLQQCLQFHPRFVVLGSEDSAKEFRALAEAQHVSCKILVGEEGLCQVVSDSAVDIVMAAIVGAVGLPPVLAALRHNKKVLLANKEPLVMAGELVLKTIAESKSAQLIPVDSEHSAIFQSLPHDFCEGRLFKGIYPRAKYPGVSKIVLTASGGATRDLPLEKLKDVSPEFACTHPNWAMGKKITVDSATMMNKALEVIEAFYLFGLPPERLEVLLHPQSIIHSMVYYEDASVIAQLGQPDMRTPIACALAWPERVSTKVAPLDLTQGDLTFRKFDLQRYPCLKLAYEALATSNGASTVLNAANEIAVERFLNREISFPDIYRLNASLMHSHVGDPLYSLEDIKALDAETRMKAKQWLIHKHA